MINLTRLLCGEVQSAASLRNGTENGAASGQPFVVWNITRRCNLECVHCYSDAGSREFAGELSWVECRDVIDSLAAFRVPGILLSGGEPLVHPLFFYIAGYARERELRLTLSTNGILITAEVAKKLRDVGFDHVDISLDGIGETHDKCRGRTGAFEKAVAALRHCRAAGQKCGLRLALTRTMVGDLDRILDFIEAEDIPHVCFYHLVYSGRGVNFSLLEPEETRAALDKIMDRVEAWHRAGRTREVITVDQPADGPYLLMRLEKNNPGQARNALETLRRNGGGNDGSGIGIANIDTQGNVHPDQFWQNHTLGNVREHLFGSIWRDQSDPILGALRKNPLPVKGRCAYCRFNDVCGGFRARAWQKFGDPCAEDPGCYLNHEEIVAGCPPAEQTP